MNYLNYYTRTRELISSLYVGLVIMPKALIECLKLKPKIVNKVRFLICFGRVGGEVWRKLKKRFRLFGLTHGQFSFLFCLYD